MSAKQPRSNRFGTANIANAGAREFRQPPTRFPLMIVSGPLGGHFHDPVPRHLQRR